MQLPKYIVMKLDSEPRSTVVTITDISDRCTVIEHEPSRCDNCELSGIADERCELCGIADIDNYEPKKWATPPKTERPTVNTTCVNVIASRVVDREELVEYEPQTDCAWK